MPPVYNQLSDETDAKGFLAQGKAWFYDDVYEQHRIVPLN